MVESDGAKLIRLVMKHAGMDVLTVFLRAYGGRRVSLPSQPGPKHRLSLMLGHEVATVVCRAFATGEDSKAGCIVDVPMSLSSGYFKIFNEVERLTGLGWSVGKIAAHTGVCRRTIQRHRAKLRRRPAGGRAQDLPAAGTNSQDPAS